MKSKTVYICSNCGNESPKWQGLCQNCDEWNTFEEQTKIKETISRNYDRPRKEIIKLSDVTSSNSERIITGINEFDRVMGGGIVKDSLTIITAKPGAGKSTLLLQVAQDLCLKGRKVIYASGEESESQIKSRSTRIFDKASENLWVFCDNSLNSVIYHVNKVNPDLVILDSIQTFQIDEIKESKAGSPTQTMECANELLKLAKNPERPRAIIIVGQMTKKDEMAGLRALEHLVDTVLVIEGDSDEELRGLSVTKNRFGSTWERGFFSMTERGMISIDNPSQYFMTKREDEKSVSGSAITVIRDGSRPIIVEVESLVSASFTPFPSRICECLGKDQLNTLLSILEQRGGVKLYDKNVVLKTTGGLKLKEQSVNLAIIMCIVSSVYDKPISNDCAFISDVGLTGELKKVPALESRIRELDRMGFNKVYIAKGALGKNVKFKDIQVVEKNTLIEIIHTVLK
ncbi:DNA repair protein RadA [Alkalibaculum sp. M08DMB]|uniref:DNA repair protein RadA n=1 Tax=Alkalibaculum sporogenes TaxID=2655001 RepID=A0A6A7KDT9_9FIRM|nr:DNA repair protein RadA [Alkalibaculum sporogenes]MPW27317.1 DNA repair protein RadA [Alkalibaculum sporogenes]